MLAFDPKDNVEVIATAGKIFKNKLSINAKVNFNIHSDDEMYINDLLHLENNTESAFINYYRNGINTLDLVQRVAKWRFGGLEKVNNFLEFACGYGRFSRWLVELLPPEKIWVSDIYEGGVEFVTRNFGVSGIVSVNVPEEYECQEKFDMILVVSLFSHLPEATFTRWLKKLYSLLKPEGVLIFTCHDESLRTPEMETRASGHYFAPCSESRSLDVEEYGTACVSEAFVAEAVFKATDGEGKYFRVHKGLNDHQDVYIAINKSVNPIADFVYESRPTGWIDSLTVTEDNQLRIKGWAASLNGTTKVEEVSIYIGGDLKQKCLPFLYRPDVKEYLGNAKLLDPGKEYLGDDNVLYSGWECYCHLDKKTQGENNSVVVKVTTSDRIEYIIYCSTLKIPEH